MCVHIRKSIVSECDLSHNLRNVEGGNAVQFFVFRFGLGWVGGASKGLKPTISVANAKSLKKILASAFETKPISHRCFFVRWVGGGALKSSTRAHMRKRSRKLGHADFRPAPRAANQRGQRGLTMLIFAPHREQQISLVSVV